MVSDEAKRMMRRPIIITALSLIATPAHADEATRREVLFQALNVADTITTLDCLHRNVCTEANPLFGKRPSGTKLIGGKIAFGALHWLAFRYLHDRDPKAARTFSTISVVIQGGVVAANLRFAF